MDASRELSVTSRLLGGSYNSSTSSVLSADGRKVVNYAIQIGIGNTSKITLPYATRLSYQKAIETLANKYGLGSALPNVSGTDYCIGHWYGAMRLPSTTVAVPDGGNAPLANGNGKLENGYIIVAFDDVMSANGTENYLEYVPTDVNMDVKLPNGGSTIIPDNPSNVNDGGIPVVIYEMIADKIDYESAGTH